jgi:hypothetical protein
LRSWRQEEEEKGETCRERKGEMVQPPCEVVGWLLVVEMVMNKTVVVAEGHGGERKKRQFIVVVKTGEKVIFLPDFSHTQAMKSPIFIQYGRR